MRRYFRNFSCLIFVLAITTFTQHSFGQASKKEYLNRISIIQNNINKFFFVGDKGLYLENIGKHEKPFSYLWPLCALIQATNETEMLGYKNTMKPVVKAINQYYTNEPPSPSYQSYINKSSRFYDDNQWIAIAYLDAYNRTKNPFYLNKSKEIYSWLLTGYDEKIGGGLYWKEDEKTSKNTCSNGPNILISLQLYKITKEKKYLDTALLVYDWTNKTLRSPDGIFYDAIKIASSKIDYATYTYNTGTMLQANALLYEITGDDKYLNEAKTIATAAEKHFYKHGKLPDHYWFNVVFMRGYLELYKIEKDLNRLDFLINDAERIWRDERDENNLLGKEKNKSLIMQAGMLEFYARLAQLPLTKL